MPRLFSGLEIPPEAATRLMRLAQPLPGARWLDQDSLHITLRFFGHVDRRTGDDLMESLDRVHCDPLTLRLSGVGTFGGREPRALWAGLAPCPPLYELARSHERIARQAGLAPERRKFKPHITLARLRATSADVVARFLQKNSAFTSPEFTVNRFVLFSSKSGTGGGPYVVEAAYPFAGVPTWADEEDFDA